MGSPAASPAALAALRPEARVFGCEVETAAPLTASLAAGSPQTVDFQPSFVDGIGGSRVTDVMWPMVSSLLAGSVVVTLDEVRAALRLLASRARVVAEGAGAVALAASLTGRAGSGRIVAIVSGGNIDLPVLAEQLTLAGP